MLTAFHLYPSTGHIASSGADDGALADGKISSNQSVDFPGDFWENPSPAPVFLGENETGNGVSRDAYRVKRYLALCIAQIL